MIEIAYFCLIPGAVVLGLAIVIVAEWPIGWLMNNVVGKNIDYPKKPGGITSGQYKQITKKTPPRGGDMVGRFERAFFFFAVLAGAPALVGIWMAFKVASKWDAWSNIYQVPDTVKDVNTLDWFLIRRSFGALIYQRFLIGTAANFLAAVIGASIIRGTVSLVKQIS